MESVIKKITYTFLAALLLQNSDFIYGQSTTKKDLSAEEIAQEKKKLAEKIAKNWHEFQKKPRRIFYSDKSATDLQTTYVQAMMNSISKLARSRYQKITSFEKYQKTIVDVAINSDGTLRKARLIKSSGIKAIDDFILKAVKDSAPFNAFRKDIFDTEILHVTRSMGFKAKKGVQN